MSKLSTAKLMAAASAARKHSKLNIEIGQLFEERYGVTYSEADEDWLIDALDYGGANVTLKECDTLMAEAGHPPIAKGRGQP